MIHISNIGFEIDEYEKDYDDYDYGDADEHDISEDYANDERNFDDARICDCGTRMIKGKESYEYGGSSFTVDEYYCPNCG